MALHRYWRATGVLPLGGGALSLQEFHLLAMGVRVDAPASFTSNIAPDSGSLAALKDDDLTTGAAWPASVGSRVEFAWDFGVATNVTNLQLAGDDPALFPVTLDLQWSDNGVTWVSYARPRAIAWPGRRVKSDSESQFRWSNTSDGLYAQGGTTDDRLLSDTLQPGGDTVWASGGYHRGLIFEAPRSAGIWHIEFLVVNSSGLFAAGSTGNAVFGAAVLTASVGGDVRATPGSRAVIASDGTKTNPAGGAVVAYSSAVASATILGMVCDFTAGTITFYRNGVSMGVAYADIAGLTLVPMIGNSFFLAHGRIAQTITHPVAGATPWFEDVLIKQTVGRSVVRVGPAVGNSEVFLPGGEIEALIVKPVERGRIRKDYGAHYVGAGIGRVKGTTKDKGTPNLPVSERVRLHKQRDGQVIREVWSQPGTGAYSFDWIDELETYYVVTFDKEGAYRAVVADGLTLANGGVELIA